jgi:hypothetical protein
MGTGKTATTLTALDYASLSEDVYPALVLAPVRVARDTWADEAGKWPHLRNVQVQPVLGTPAERKAALKADANVFAINYENVGWLVDTVGDKWPFASIIADESRKLHGFRGGYRTSSSGRVYYQGAGGQRTRALGRKAHLSKRFIELTGTPAPNGLLGLWGQVWFLDGGKRLGRTFEAFKERWFYPKHPDRKNVDPRAVRWVPYEFAEREIYDRIGDLCFSLNPKDWFDLKDPIRTTIWVDLPPKARQVYKSMEDQFFAMIGKEEINAGNAAAKSQKLLQLANGASYTGEHATQWADLHNAKIDALEDVIEEAEGAAVMVAYQWRHDLEKLKKAFPAGVDLSTRAGLASFKAGDATIGFGHPDAVGHGIDGLQNICNIIAFFGHWWDMETRQQIIERIGPVRQYQAGLDRPVWIYDIVARNTVDELVLLRHETKREVQDLLLEATNRRAK